MEFSRRVAQLLHEDHLATIATIEALETMIARARRNAPDTGEDDVKRILRRAADTIEQEVGNHFTFEENELFTRLADMGDVGIGEHLSEEHRAILPLAGQVAALARDALADGFDAESWKRFRTLGGELIERMLAHIQKEEMALLPMLEELLDPETDMELSEAYSLNQ